MKFGKRKRSFMKTLIFSLVFTTTLAATNLRATENDGSKANPQFPPPVVAPGNQENNGLDKKEKPAPPEPPSNQKNPGNQENSNKPDKPEKPENPNKSTKPEKPEHPEIPASPKNVKAMLKQFEDAREEYLHQQAELRRNLHQASGEDLETLRERLRQQQAEFLAHQRELRRSIKEQIARLKDELRDHQRVIEAAKEKARNRRGVDE